MKIHAIQTGTVALTTRWREGAGRGRLRLLNTLADRNWTEPLPIYAFAIEHPEGVIVFDTGETARVTEPGYFRHPVARLAVRMDIRPEQEIGPQLEALGIAPHEVRRVVLSHLHTDHAGGLHHFEGVETLAARADFEEAKGFAGRVRGYPSHRWPTWFDPTLVDLPAEPYGAFERSMPLTEAGDVRLVAIPGHTPGQMGLVVEEDDHVVLLGADSSYTQEAMLRGILDGISPDLEAERRTHDAIRAFAAERPTVYLPSHDPESAARLAAREPAGAAAYTGSAVGG
jgi:glyoxylase-like metal-dependent hydrolase (beta-lactamase superfamily II)